MKNAIGSNETRTGLIPFDAWLGELGKTRATGWRWRKIYPWLAVVNVLGRLYITRESVAEFERRAKAGELSREPSGAAEVLASKSVILTGREVMERAEAI